MHCKTLLHFLLPFLLDNLPLAVGPVVYLGRGAPWRPVVVVALLVGGPGLRGGFGEFLLLAVDGLLLVDLLHLPHLARLMLPVDVLLLGDREVALRRGCPPRL